MSDSARPPPGSRAAAAKRAGRRARRTARSIPYITRKIPLTECAARKGSPRSSATPIRCLRKSASSSATYPARSNASAAPAPTSRASACAFRAASRESSARRRRRSLHPARAQPRAQRRDRRQAMVFAPNYGSPFVHDLDKGRRYGTIEDFRNFVKLAYLSPYIHHSGGTVCEPVDLPVNKRHFEMVYAHMRYSDKPFMGSVTQPERAADTVACARSCSARTSSRTTRYAPASSTPIRRWSGIRPCSARRRPTRAPTRPASSRRSSCPAR